MSSYLFTQQEMQRYGIRYFSEALARSPGFSHYDVEYTGLRGPMARGQQSIWRYGFSVELAPVPDWADIYLPMDFFKHIEIIRGPAGLSWGSNAEAGLFNLQIRDDLRGSQASVEAGNHGRQQFTYMYGDQFSSGNRDDNSIFVGFSGGQQDYTTQNDAWDTAGETWLSNGWKPSYAMLSKIDYKQVKTIYMKTSGDKVTPSWDDEQVQDALLAAQGEPLHDNMEIEIFRGEYHFQFSDATNSLLQNPQLSLYLNHYVKNWWVEGFANDGQRKDSVGFATAATLADDTIDLTAGGDLWSREVLNAPSFTHPDFTQPPYSPDNNWFGGVYAASTYASQNLYLQARLKQIADWHFIIGGRYDWSDDYRDASKFTPRLGAIYFADEHITHKLLWNQTQRQPTANELLSSAQAPGAEQLQSFEYIFLFNYPQQIYGDITLYSQMMDNQIVFDTGPNLYRNTNGSDAIGMEWNIKSDYWEQLELYCVGSYLSKFEINTDDAINNPLIISTEPFNSKGEFLFVPELSATLGADIGLHSNAAYETRLNLDYRMHRNIPYFIDAAHNEAYKNLSFYDAGIRTRFKNQDITAALYVRNITNTQDAPAYGEHAALFDYGHINPESRSVWLKLAMAW